MAEYIAQEQLVRTVTPELYPDELEELLGKDPVQNQNPVEVLTDIISKMEQLEQKIDTFYLEQVAANDLIGNTVENTETKLDDIKTLEPTDLADLKESINKNLTKHFSNLNIAGEDFFSCLKSSSNRNRNRFLECLFMFIQMLFTTILYIYQVFLAMYKILSGAAAIPINFTPPGISHLLSWMFNFTVTTLLAWVYIKLIIGAITFGYVDGINLVEFVGNCSVALVVWMFNHTKSYIVYIIKDAARIPGAFGGRQLLKFCKNGLKSLATNYLVPDLGISQFIPATNITEIVGGTVDSMMTEAANLINATQILNNAATNAATRLLGNFGPRIFGLTGGTPNLRRSLSRRIKSVPARVRRSSSRRSYSSRIKSEPMRVRRSSARRTKKARRTDITNRTGIASKTMKNGSASKNDTVRNRKNTTKGRILSTKKENKKALEIVNLALRATALIIKVNIGLLMMHIEYGDEHLTNVPEITPLVIAGINVNYNGNLLLKN